MERLQTFRVTAARSISVAATVVGGALLLTLVQAEPAPASKGASASGGRRVQSREELATGTWNVDRSQTQIGFTVSHLRLSRVSGRFKEYDGTVIADGKKPENSSVTFTIKAASIDTANTRRDDHLRGADFFDVTKYPDITFKSTKVQPRSRGGFNAIGTLTMHGVSKEVTLPFTVEGPVKGPGGTLQAGVDTRLRLSRRDYGLLWNSFIEGAAVLSDQIDINIHLALVKAKA